MPHIFKPCNPASELLDRHDIHELLANKMQIAVIWSVEDVLEIRPDLDDAKAWEVLQHCRSNHDACHGINWETLDVTADYLFPTS